MSAHSENDDSGLYVYACAMCIERKINMAEKEREREKHGLYNDTHSVLNASFFNIKSTLG